MLLDKLVIIEMKGDATLNGLAISSNVMLDVVPSTGRGPVQFWPVVVGDLKTESKGFRGFQYHGFSSYLV